mgnify:CR=1 FL=1
MTDKPEDSKNETTKVGEEVDADEDDELDIVPMVAGDYMIHVFLQKGKNFKTDDDKDTIDAICQIDTCSQIKYSEVHKGCTLNNSKGQYFGEHFFIEAKKMSKDDISESNVTIKLLNKGLFRDKVIGIFDIDIANIYSMNDKHVLEHQWVALNNPDSETPNEIKAYLKVSINIQGPNDSSV